MSTPTEEAYTELQQAYDFFNVTLFGNQLPPSLITMQRKNRTYGYFSGRRWASNSGAITDEIAMNPQHFARRGAEEILSTLAHEMVHLWQHHFGKPSRSGYHNKEWANKMESIGLRPSDTGLPGGKLTGQHMTHYIMKDGPFARVCAILLAQGFRISWAERAGNRDHRPKSTRTKYICPHCGLNAWAKPNILLVCGTCNERLQPESVRRR